MVRKRFALCLCALVALVVVAGCGGGSGSSPSGGKADANKPVTLTVWDWSVPDPKAMKKIDDAYMAEHPNVTIKRVHQPFASYFTLMHAAVAARKGPDLFMDYDSPFIFDFKNGILPLNDLRTPDDAKNLQGWQYDTEDGQILGVPFTGNGTIFYYNKALFRQAGLDPNKPPATWDEFINSCDKLKAAGITPIVGGFKDGYYAEWLIMQFAHQYQSDAEINKATNDPDWNSPGMEKGFERIQELYKHGCFTKDSEAIPLFPNTVDNFKAGKGAMFVGLSAIDIDWSEFRATKWGKKDLGTFLAPLVPDSLWTEQRINYSPAIAYAITRWAPEPQAAYDFASYMASAKSQETLFKLSGAFPNRTDVTLNVTDPVAKQLLEWVKTKPQYAGQQTLVRANVDAVFDKLVPQIVTGQSDYKDVSAQIQAEQDKAAAH